MCWCHFSLPSHRRGTSKRSSTHKICASPSLHHRLQPTLPIFQRSIVQDGTNTCFLRLYVNRTVFRHFCLRFAQILTSRRLSISQIYRSKIGRKFQRSQREQTQCAMQRCRGCVRRRRNGFDQRHDLCILNTKTRLFRSREDRQKRQSTISWQLCSISKRRIHSQTSPCLTTRYQVTGQTFYAQGRMRTTRRPRASFLYKHTHTISIYANCIRYPLRDINL